MASTIPGSAIGEIPGHKYQQLLQQVSELQKDLSESLQLCHKLKTQNVGLQANFERLKQDNLQLSSDLNTAQDYISKFDLIQSDSEKKRNQ